MNSTILLAACLTALLFGSAHADTTYELDVLPTDRTVLTDSVTGATLTFLTTNTPSSSIYFHEHSWLSNESMIIFRGGPLGLLGYLTATGKLVRLTTPDGGIGGVTAAASRPSVFGMRGHDLVELAVRVEPSSDPARRSRVEATERVIATLSFGGQLNTRNDDRYVSIGTSETIYIVDTESGELRKICDITPPNVWRGHLQWSRSDLYRLSWASRSDVHVDGGADRLPIVDIREGVQRAPYTAREGELFTHESWWVDDQIVFCGALRPNGQDQSHVKVMDAATGVVRIAGAGAWWPGATASELAKRNWWRCAGSADGRWIVADNWHGDIMLFEGTTARPRLLTEGHRIYGGGTHPEPGWDRSGKRVIFSSHMLSTDVNVCVADIPDEWQDENPAPVRSSK